jgi:hypothetical protein
VAEPRHDLRRPIDAGIPRQPDVTRKTVESAELFPHHADDGHDPPVEGDGLTGEVAIAAEQARPGLLPEHRDGLAFVAGTERTSDQHPRAKRPEIVARHGTGDENPPLGGNEPHVLGDDGVEEVGTRAQLLIRLPRKGGADRRRRPPRNPEQM